MNASKDIFIYRAQKGKNFPSTTPLFPPDKCEENSETAPQQQEKEPRLVQEQRPVPGWPQVQKQWPVQGKLQEQEQRQLREQQPAHVQEQRQE